MTDKEVLYFMVGMVIGGASVLLGRTVGLWLIGVI
jgi:hypothetical protein